MEGFELEGLDVQKISEVVQKNGGLFLVNQDAVDAFTKGKIQEGANEVTKKNQKLVMETIEKITGKKIEGVPWTKAYPDMLTEVFEENKRLVAENNELKISGGNLEETTKKQNEKLKAHIKEMEISAQAKAEKLLQDFEEFSAKEMRKATDFALLTEARASYLHFKKALQSRLTNLEVAEKTATQAQKTGIRQQIDQLTMVSNHAEMTLNFAVEELKKQYNFSITENGELEVLNKEGIKVKNNDAYASDFKVADFINTKMSKIFETFQIPTGVNDDRFSSAPTKPVGQGSRMTFEEKVNSLTIPSNLDPVKDMQAIFSDWQDKLGISNTDPKMINLRLHLHKITTK